MDVSIGDTIPEWHIAAVDAAAMKTTALLLRDPNPIHWDTDRLERLGLGDRPINQGPLHVGYLLEMLADWLGPLGTVDHLSCRFDGNVLAGDAVTAGGRVTGLESSEVGRRISCEVWLVRNDSEAVVTGSAELVLSHTAGSEPTGR